MKSIYYSLIYSHIVYAIQVWGSANDSELNKILILQKKAVRMMLFKDQYPQISGCLNPSDPLFSELSILKIHDVFKLQIVKFIYDCLMFNTPSNFWNWFVYNSTAHFFFVDRPDPAITVMILILSCSVIYHRVPKYALFRNTS